MGGLSPPAPRQLRPCNWVTETDLIGIEIFWRNLFVLLLLHIRHSYVTPVAPVKNAQVFSWWVRIYALAVKHLKALSITKELFDEKQYDQDP